MAALCRAHAMDGCFFRQINCRTVPRCKSTKILNDLSSFFKGGFFSRNYCACETTSLWHDPGQNPKLNHLFVIVGFLFATRLDFPISPLLNPLELVCFQSSVVQAIVVAPRFVLRSFDLILVGSRTLEIAHCALELQKTWILSNLDLLLGWQTSWKTSFLEFPEGLEVIDMIMLGRFVEEGGSPVDGREVRHVVPTVSAKISLRDVLGPLNFGVSLYVRQWKRTPHSI